MRFNRQKFNRFLTNIGQEVIWKHSHSCACVNPETGSANPKHALCNGKGRIWAPGVKTTIGISKQDTDENLAAMGHYDTGDLSVTIPENSPAWDGCGQFDRVMMLNSTDVFSLPLKRGAPTERLIFSVSKVTRVFWLNSGGQLVEGGIPVVNQDGTLTWVGGIGEPPPGASYSITGEKFTEYYVYGHFPSDRNEHKGMRLPKRCVLRKFDLFNR